MIVLGYNFTPAPGYPNAVSDWYRFCFYTLGAPGLVLLVVGLVLQRMGYRKARWLSWIGVALMVWGFILAFTTWV